MLEFVKWWYGPGWADTVIDSKKRLLTLGEMFSVAILLRTLFAPWKRIISYPGSGLEAHMRAILDNLVSRVIGFFVRIMVLFSASVMFVLFCVIGLVQIATWPLLPLAGAGLIVWGLL
jgi:hypothetical protein